MEARIEVLLEIGEFKKEILLDVTENGTALQQLEKEFRSLGNYGYDFKINESGTGSCSHIIQKFSPKWDCFVNIENADLSNINNGDRLTVVKKRELSPKGVQGATKTGHSLSLKLGKPSESDGKVLATLFPTRSIASQKRKFDPLDELVVSKQKSKKKATRVKSRKVTVVFVQDASDSVPRGRKRAALTKDGCVKQLEFNRNMTAHQTYNVIVRGFSNIFTTNKAPCFSFLMPDPKTHILTKIEQREMSGEELINFVGQGSLYIREMYSDGKRNISDSSTCNKTRTLSADVDDPQEGCSKWFEGTTSVVNQQSINTDQEEQQHNYVVSDGDMSLTLEAKSDAVTDEMKQQQVTENQFEFDDVLLPDIKCSIVDTCTREASVLEEEDKKRIEFMERSLVPSIEQVRYINRESLFEDMMDIYRNCGNAQLKNPFYMTFIGEQAIDLGGVSRDAMTGYWQEAYKRMFDGSSFLVPIVNPSVDLAVFPILGRVLSHGYLSTGFLPVQIALPTLIAILLCPEAQLEHCLLVEAFLDYVNDVDRDVLRRAIKHIKHSTSDQFPTDLIDELLTIFGIYGLRAVPSPDSFKILLQNTARFIFLHNPMSAINAMHSGIPDCHKQFWNRKTPVDVHKIYTALTATPSKVLSRIEEPIYMNSAQKTVFGYLRQYIGNMTPSQVRSILRFWTGSSVCAIQNLEVNFNTLSGIARRPIAHTCSRTLEISSTYASLQDLENEFRLTVADDNLFSWIMDSL